MYFIHIYITPGVLFIKMLVEVFIINEINFELAFFSVQE